MTCRYHLYTDVDGNGEMRLPQPGRALRELTVTCALDVADEGGRTLEEVGQLFGLTRERVRQVEKVALRKFKRKFKTSGLAEDAIAHLRDSDARGARGNYGVDGEGA